MARFAALSVMLLFAVFAEANAAAPIDAIPADLAAPFPPTSVEAEGQRHLVYELHITNLGQTELSLDGLEIADAKSGSVLQHYEGESLSGILARLGTAGLPDRRVIGPGLRAIAFIDVITPVSSAAPVALFHRLRFKPVTPENAFGEQRVVTGGRVHVAREPVVVGPPFRGGPWLASHALSNESSHRRSLIVLNGKVRIAQRFAIDWTKIGADGQIFRGDPAINANWSPYGAEVLAIADARVSDVADGIAENDPTSDKKAVPITFDNAAGNHVILDLGRGRFALYAHLKPHSIRVRVGQKVKRGDVLALLGNSGKADAPHLHLQIMDANSPLAAEGLPFEFDSFELLGHVPSLKVFTDGTGWHATATPSRHRREMPVENAVVQFP